jgi:hypothetical protein
MYTIYNILLYKIKKTITRTVETVESVERNDFNSLRVETILHDFVTCWFYWVELGRTFHLAILRQAGTFGNIAKPGRLLVCSNRQLVVNREVV